MMGLVDRGDMMTWPIDWDAAALRIHRQRQQEILNEKIRQIPSPILSVEEIKERNRKAKENAAEGVRDAMRIKEKA